MTRLISLCEPVELDVLTVLELDPLSFPSTRLRELQISTFETAQGGVNSLHLWLQRINGSAATLEELRIPGNIELDEASAFDPVTISNFPRLKYLGATSVSTGPDFTGNDVGARTTSVYRTFLQRGAATLRFVDFSPFQARLPRLNEMVQGLPRLQGAKLWYCSSTRHDELPIIDLKATQQMLDLAAFSSIKTFELDLLDPRDLIDMLGSCVICFGNRAWLPNVRTLTLEIYTGDATPAEVDSQLEPQGAIRDAFRELKRLCLRRGAAVTFEGMIPSCLQPELSSSE